MGKVKNEFSGYLKSAAAAVKAFGDEKAHEMFPDFFKDEPDIQLNEIVFYAFPNIHKRDDFSGEKKPCVESHLDGLKATMKELASLDNEVVESYGHFPTGAMQKEYKELFSLVGRHKSSDLNGDVADAMHDFFNKCLVAGYNTLDEICTEVGEEKDVDDIRDALFPFVDEDLLSNLKQDVLPKDSRYAENKGGAEASSAPKIPGP